jgi:hypothetical protein
MEAARSIDPKRVRGQERWVYETLRLGRPYADWELWEMAPRHLFDKLSSLHRTRIGLMWRSRSQGITPWHPVEDSLGRVICPDSGKRTVLWQTKEKYLELPYDIWAANYRALAKGKRNAARF